MIPECGDCKIYYICEDDKPEPRAKKCLKNSLIKTQNAEVYTVFHPSGYGPRMAHTAD